VLTVQYTGAYKLIVKASQAAEITRQKVVQGFGSGKVEKTFSDSSLLTQDAALVSAKAKLLHYARLAASCSTARFSQDLRLVCCRQFRCRFWA
jgi:hypothetical protein